MESKVKKITQELKKGKILVSDGAWGTYLHQNGLKPDECPESWNVKNPDIVYNIAKSYIDSGSDIVETNSFGGSSFKLGMFNLADKVYEYNKAAAELSRKAAGDKIVIGSVGPTGKILMMGEVTEEELYESFKEQVIALKDGGVDGIVIETMSAIDEALCAIRAAKENTDCEIICTMTFEKGPDGSYNTMMGVTPAEMVSALIEAGVDVLGANCGNGSQRMIEIVKEIRAENSEIPILIHANAGMPQFKDGCTVFPESPDEMASYVKSLIDAGANVIGGCCGTTPEHIKRISKIISKS